MLVISHRGSNRKAPENSMEAMTLSIDEGAARIELDLWLSSDNEIYVNHDDSLARTTSSKKKISECTIEDLNKTRLPNGERLLNLNQVLTLLEKVELNLELKGSNLKLAEATSKIVKDHPLKDKIIISSFNIELLEEAHKHCPEVRRAYLWEKDETSPLAEQLIMVKTNLERVKTNIFHPEARAYNDEIDKFRWLNDLLIYTWSELKDEEQRNDSHLWKKLYDYRVDGHCTNLPLELAYFIREQIIKG